MMVKYIICLIWNAFVGVGVFTGQLQMNRFYQHHRFSE